MKVRAIIQARMGSERLRGKSLMPVAGKPLLLRVISMVKQMPFVDEVQIVTTTLEEDTPIFAYSSSLGVKCFRGDSLNVLNRFVEASRDLNENDHIIRITADNPLNWKSVSKKILDLHLENEVDYSCIDGLSHIVFEVVRVGALHEIDELGVLTDYDKEHVTAYLRNSKGTYDIQIIPSRYFDLRSDLDSYLTIDTFQDLQRFEKIANELGEFDDLEIPDVYNWLDNEINKEQIKH